MCLRREARAQDCYALPHLYELAASMGGARLDLVGVGRQLARERGMPEAVRALESLATLQDASRGRFERDLVRAVHESAYRVPDAIDALPVDGEGGAVRRGDLLFLFVNGLGQREKSFSTRLLTESVDHLRSRGFRAEVLETGPYASTERNGEVILAQLKSRLAAPETRHVVIVAVSKGTHDLIHALSLSDTVASRVLSPMELGKLRYVVSISGVVRSSAIAGWLARSRRFPARLVRTFMRAPLVGNFPNLDGVESLTRDPWEHVSADVLRDLDCVWLSFVVFPDGADGSPKTGFVRRKVLRSLRGSQEVGPYDGLTESASSLLPPGTGLEQWVVRVRGAHGIVKGMYVDGTPVVTKGRGAPALQIIDPLLRTLPLPRS